MSGAKGKTGDAARNCVRCDGVALLYRSGLFGRQQVEALRDVSFSLPSASLTALVGANGSGKSSLLRCLLGFEARHRGEIEILGLPAGDRLLRGRLGATLDARLPLGRLSGREYLRLAASVAGADRSEARRRADSVLDQLELSFAADRAHARYSAGMARRLAFAEALVREPELLVLDEPGSGLDPIAVSILRRTLEAQRAQGRSAIVATHVLDALGAELFDRVLVLEEGRLIHDGAPDVVLARGERDEDRPPAHARLSELLQRGRSAT